MFCKQCGKSFEGDVKYCSECGTPSNSPHNLKRLSSEYVRIKDNLASSTLAWGIIGFIFSMSAGFFGIIFSLIGLNKGKKYITYYGEPSSKVSAGRGLASAGLTLGVINTLIIGAVAALIISVAVFDVGGIMSELEYLCYYLF